MTTARTVPLPPDRPSLSGPASMPGPSLCPSRLSVPSMKAAALELAILTGRLFLYPSGMVQERGTVPVEPPADALRPPERPVVLLHGFIDNRSVFVLLRRSLAGRGGRHVESLNHSPLTRDIRLAAGVLAERVEEICERTGQREVDIVGHSLGGLIARYYVQRLGGDARVRTLVTLGAPHGGTRVARVMSALTIVRQMCPRSDVITELREPAAGCRTRFVCLWSDLDQIVAPLEAAAIDHPDLIVRNVRVSGVGHLALPVHPAVIDRVVQELAEDGRAADRGDLADGLTVA